ncbi:hypothetical protein D0T50_03555 [Bacteroides sp. 214]|uniref:hypothetical protein n=1 Tax=Bacteroides sp. 214 TaxID=2302935 RepID=UPI0013D3AD48|nr:hypothetical protein [Bacteroides sp. 214]NDW11965.1 hypothetical protein [Bacteroides sp. 214]
MNLKNIFQRKATVHYKVDMDKVIEFVTKGYKLGDLHGLPHWQRVERNGSILAQPGVNPYVVKLFAYFHDACRESDGRDIEHGIRAAKMIESLRSTLLKNLTNNEFLQLMAACELHTTTIRVGDLTIDTCFDADRLDLGRCGIVIAPNRMATSKGRFFAENIDLFNTTYHNDGL